MTFKLESIGAITLFVEDVDRSKAWYQHVFDRPLIYEDDASAVIKFDNTIINLLMIPAAHALISPAVVGSLRSGTHSQFTIWVDDADGVCDELLRRGVTLINGPMDREWGQRTACFADLDGHIWEVAQTLS